MYATLHACMLDDSINTIESLKIELMKVASNPNEREFVAFQLGRVVEQNQQAVDERSGEECSEGCSCCSEGE